MSTAKDRQQYRHRQALVSTRARAAGQARIGIWIPGDVHEKIKQEAASRGITMRDLIIRKLRA